MEWMQAALEALEESDGSEDNETFAGANDILEKFDEKTFKENEDLLKFGRDHLNRIKNNKSDNKSTGFSTANTKLLDANKSQNFFTLQTNREIEKFKKEDLSVKDEDISPKKETPKPSPINDKTVQFDQSLNGNFIQQSPKGKEWRGYEKCITHVYGQNIFDNIPGPTNPNLGPLKEDLRSINFNLPAQIFTTADGDILESNQIRRTQKRKHQINWLAMEAQEREFDLLQQTAHMRKTKRETQMKYGW